VTIKLWGSENCRSTACSAIFLTEPQTGKPYGDAGGWPNTIDDANNAEPVLIGTYGIAGPGLDLDGGAKVEVFFVGAARNESEEADPLTGAWFPELCPFSFERLN
jgi:hypothetical protein